LFSLGDMIRHNRRKRTEFFIEQHALLQKRLVEAQAAAARGEADEDQMLLLNQEQAAEEAEQARKNRKGFWATLASPFSTARLKTEEVDSSLVNLPGDGQAQRVAEDQAVMVPVNRREGLAEEYGKSRILSAVEEKRREVENPLEDRGFAGGPLDTRAEEMTHKVSGAAKKSWTGWLSR